MFFKWCYFSNFLFFSFYFKFFFFFQIYADTPRILFPVEKKNNFTFFLNNRLKKRLSYFLFLSNSNEQLHWSYKSLLIKKFSNPRHTAFLNFNFLLKELYIVFNLFSNLLAKNYSFFIFNFDFLINDIHSFSKYIFGVKNVLKYSFVFKYDLKKFRNFKWKAKFNFFVKKKKVKLVFLLDIYNGFFFVDYLKTLKIITVGLIPQNMSPTKLDFWFITNSHQYLIKYLFFSYVYSVYNACLSDKMFKFFQVYHKNLHKYITTLK